MEDVYLLAPSVHRNLEHFISSAGSLSHLDELGHAVDRAGLALVFEALDLGYGAGSISGSDHAAFLEEVDFSGDIQEIRSVILSIFSWR